MTDIPATAENCKYFERLARLAESMGELDPDQATILSEVCIASNLHRNKPSGLRKEELADLHNRSNLTKCAPALPSSCVLLTSPSSPILCWIRFSVFPPQFYHTLVGLRCVHPLARLLLCRFQAHRAGIAGTMLASRFAIFRAMSTWGV